MMQCSIIYFLAILITYTSHWDHRVCYHFCLLCLSNFRTPSPKQKQKKIMIDFQPVSFVVEMMEKIIIKMELLIHF